MYLGLYYFVQKKPHCSRVLNLLVKSALFDECNYPITMIGSRHSDSTLHPPLLIDRSADVSCILWVVSGKNFDAFSGSRPLGFGDSCCGEEGKMGM